MRRVHHHRNRRLTEPWIGFGLAELWVVLGLIVQKGARGGDLESEFKEEGPLAEGIPRYEAFRVQWRARFMGLCEGGAEWKSHRASVRWVPCAR